MNFQYAINNDAKANSCTLMAWDSKGCTRKSSTQQPHVETDENQCVDNSLNGGIVLGAKSFSMKR